MQTLLVKAETIGDAYIVASAVPVPTGKETCTPDKEVSTMLLDLPAKILTYRCGIGDHAWTQGWQHLECDVQIVKRKPGERSAGTTQNVTKRKFWKK